MENLSQQELINKVLTGQLTQDQFDKIIYQIMEQAE